MPNIANIIEMIILQNLTIDFYFKKIILDKIK